MHRYEIGLAQKSIQIDQLGTQFLLGRLVALHVLIKHAHIPATMAALRQRVANSPHAKDAERPASQVSAEVAKGFPSFPFTGPGVGMPFDDTAGGGDEQAKSHVRRSIRKHAGSV